MNIEQQSKSLSEKEAYEQVMKMKPKLKDVSKEAKSLALLHTLVIAVALIFIILIFEFFLFKETSLERIIISVIFFIMICTFYFVRSWNNSVIDLTNDKVLDWEKEVVDPYIQTIPRKINTKIYSIDLDKTEKTLNAADVIFNVDGELINRYASINIDENIEEPYVSYIKVKYDIDSVRFSDFHMVGDIKNVILHINEAELKKLLR